MRDDPSLRASDLERSHRFYNAALRPLGLTRRADFAGGGSDYGVGRDPPAVLSSQR
jgi:hypothetical protein